jgi:hypothetical protein
MDFRVTVCAAGFALAFSLAPGKAEVVAVASTFAINDIASIGDTPNVSDDTEVAGRASSGDFEVQSAPIASHDTFGSDPGSLAVTAVPELPTWATTLLSFAGFGR